MPERYVHESAPPSIEYPIADGVRWRPKGATYNIGRNKAKRLNRQADKRARVAQRSER